MIEGGYILKARKTLESDLMDKPPLYSKLWDWMLLRAEWREGRKLARGQFHTTIEEMRDAMSWKVGYRVVKPSKKEIRSAYEWFSRKSDEGHTKGTMIGTTRGTRGIIITINNYKEYQTPENYEGRSEGHDERGTKGELGAHDSKEYKNIRKKKEEKKRAKALSTDNSAESSGHRPSKCSPEDWEKYLAYSRRFLERQQEMLGKLVKITESKVVAGAKALDNLIRVQEFERRAVYETIEWAMLDDFWSTQVRSLGSLTKKGRNDETKFSNILSKRFEEVKRAQRVERNAA